jgi:stress-induced morphogen
LKLRGAGLRMMSGASGDTVVDGMVMKLEKAFSPVKLEVVPAYGDPNGSHVTISVVSKAFEGKRPVQRQQLVYKVCCGCMRLCSCARVL